MEIILDKLEALLTDTAEYFQEQSEETLSSKPAPNKWSKKEILGHLIDSAVYNLQRFTEIQFMPSPYQIRAYQQDELVKANAYQEADLNELCSCWLSINIRIMCVVEELPAEILASKLILPNGKTADLRFLIEDYVEHLEHHAKQLLK